MYKLKCILSAILLILAGCVTSYEDSDKSQKITTFNSIEIPFMTKPKENTYTIPPQYAPPPGNVGVWNDQLSVYELKGHPSTYYRDRSYIRFDKGNWYLSSNISGPWSPVAKSKVPYKLSSAF